MSLLLALVGASGTHSIVGAGGIASAEAFGQPAVATRFPIVGAGAIPSAEVFGLPSITARAAVIGAGGIASVEAFGLPTVTVIGGEVHVTGGRRRPLRQEPHEPYKPLIVPRWHKVIGAGGIESIEEFGLPRVTVRRDVNR